tara:strand:- start:362 stop:1822 length:1461 start_codon:yes stop_codon:yes gene_type:complete
MTKILIPRSDSVSAKVIEPSDFESMFSPDIINDYVKSGFTLTAGSGLAVNIAVGKARLKGLFIHNDSASSKSSLTASNTNYIYVTLARDSNSEAESWDFTSNTTGVTATDSLFIGTATTNGSSVTAVDMDNITISSGSKTEWLWGNGIDGDSTISTNTSFTKDKYFKNLTINSGITLDHSSTKMVIFCNDTLTINGTISMNGLGGVGDSSSKAAGTGGNGHAGNTSATDGGNGTAGNNGGAAIGFNTTGGTGGSGGGGGNGGQNSSFAGAGGSGGSSTSGSGGTAGTENRDTYSVIKISSTPIMVGGGGGSGAGGAGGGGGGRGYNSSYLSFGDGAGGNGGNGGIGGASGAGGGCIYLISKNIILNSTGLITSNGINGSNGTNATNGTNGANNPNNPQVGSHGGAGGGGGNGGGGGSGGLIILIYETITKNGSTTVALGTGGTGGTKGIGGSGGTGHSGNGVAGNNGTAGGNGSNGNIGIIVEHKI